MSNPSDNDKQADEDVQEYAWVAQEFITLINELNQHEVPTWVIHAGLMFSLQMGVEQGAFNLEQSRTSFALIEAAQQTHKH